MTTTLIDDSAISPAAAIEAETKRKLTIKTLVTSDNLARCHAQEQSPLFRVPAELRDEIFACATLPYEDFNPRYQNEHNQNACSPRLGHQIRQTTSTSILLTCRRAWLEANHLPLQQAMPTFWHTAPNRRPEWAADSNSSERSRLVQFMQGLTSNNRRNLEHVRIFAQTAYLECHSRSLIHAVLPPVQTQAQNHAFAAPRVLTIKIRPRDWSSWRHGGRLGTAWMEELLSTPLPSNTRLREIRLELEMLETKAGLLDQAVLDMEAIEPAVTRDQRGAARRFVLHDSAIDWMPLDDATGRNGTPCDRYDGVDALECRAARLVWKLIALPPDSPSAENPAPIRLSVLSRSTVLGSIPPSELNKRLTCLLRKLETTEARKAVLRWQELWQEQRSLLRFEL